MKSWRQIEGDIARLRGRVKELVLQAVRGEAEPRIEAAREVLVMGAA